MSSQSQAESSAYAYVTGLRDGARKLAALDLALLGDEARVYVTAEVARVANRLNLIVQVLDPHAAPDAMHVCNDCNEPKGGRA